MEWKWRWEQLKRWTEALLVGLVMEREEWTWVLGPWGNNWQQGLGCLEGQCWGRGYGWGFGQGCRGYVHTRGPLLGPEGGPES